VREATQLAPVAIVWPIRSFAALPPSSFTADAPLRNELAGLVRLCLDYQVGLHLIDEADVWRSAIENRQVVLGKAKYSHVLLPSTLVLHARTLVKLREASAAGVTVLRLGQAPKWQQTETRLEPARLDWCLAAEPGEAVKRLPRLVELGPDGADLRCTAWQHAGKATRFLMNLREKPAPVTVDRKSFVLAPGELRVLGQGTP
jgi:hypothetical protein